MTFFPADYDPRDSVIAMLDMAEIDTPDGPARFIAGTDGIFTDINTNTWTGSQLIGISSMESAINGLAPEGTMTLSYFQDPNSDILAEKINELGIAYIEGRTITFYVQPIRSQPEFYAPATAPLQWAQRTMRTLTVRSEGAQNRSIIVGFEATTEKRRASRRRVLNTEGHAQLIGEANVSLSNMPTTNELEESMFG